MYEDADDIQEYNFKVLVVGEVSVGKTSIIRRYTQGHFLTSYTPTLGADFALKVVDWDLKSRIHLQLWDVAGHERYGHMTRVYYKYAMAAFIVYDLSRPDTWNAVLKWYNDLMQNVLTEDEEPIPIVLLANKCDMNGVGYDKSYLTTFCDEHGLEGWFPVSAKTNGNIDDAMNFVISAILSKRPQKERIRPGTPWYRAESPPPVSPVTVLPAENGDIHKDIPRSTAVQRKTCC